jgi:hypothetical protein
MTPDSGFRRMSIRMSNRSIIGHFSSGGAAPASSWGSREPSPCWRWAAAGGGACAHPPGHLTCCRHRRGASALGRVPVFGAQGRVLRQTPASTALDSHLAEYANHACGRRVARQRWVDCGVDSATPTRRLRHAVAHPSHHSHAELRHRPDAGSFVVSSHLAGVTFRPLFGH